MKIVPIGNQVLLEVQSDNVTDGGIVLPDVAKKQKRMAVVAYGDEVDSNIFIGDIVICDVTKMAKVPNIGMKKEYVLVSDDGILAVIKTEGEN